MKFIQIPKIEELWESVSFETLSPSTFSWICDGCTYQILLQELLKKFDPSCQLPSPKSAILGTIIHKIYELSLKGEICSISEMVAKWEELININESKLSKVYPTLRGIDLNDYDKRNKAIRYAMSIIGKQNNTTTTTSDSLALSEKWLDCSAIGLKGIADKIIIKDDKVNIVDYKSGSVFSEDGCIKTEYVTQLHLYAAMCEFCQLGKIEMLSLVDIEGVQHNIEYNEEFKVSLCEQVFDKICYLNNIIKKKNFETSASPEASRCAWCNCRHVCQFMADNEQGFYHTIEGTVVSQPSSNMYSVLDKTGKQYYVSDLDRYSVDEPGNYLKKTLVFVNVIKASPNSESSAFKVCDNSLIYEKM